MTDEPKLTEAQLRDRLIELQARIPGVTVAVVLAELARMIAAAEETARAEAWDEGYAAADWRDQNFAEPPNPYRSTP